MRVHLDIVHPRITGRRSTGRENARLSLRPGAGGMNIGEVDAPLLPSRSDQVATDETQEALAMPHRAVAQQDVGLVHAVDWPVRRRLAADNVGEGRQE